jgi:hypothetical protein
MTLKDLKKRITSSSSTLQQQTQSFDKLITSLRTAVENDGMLDKEATSYDDVLTPSGCQCATIGLPSPGLDLGSE